MYHFLTVCAVVILLLVISRIKRKQVNKYARKFRVCNFVDGGMYEINVKHLYRSDMLTFNMMYCKRTKGFSSEHAHLSLRELRNNNHYVEIKHSTKVVR